MLINLCGRFLPVLEQLADSANLFRFGERSGGKTDGWLNSQVILGNDGFT